MQIVAFPLTRLAARSTPCPQFGIVVFEQINCSNTRCLIEPAPALFCHWQGRYSGSRLGEGFYSCAVFMLLGRSIQHSQTDTNDQCTQPRPRGSGQRSWTPGRAQHDQGGKQEAIGGQLAFIRAVQAFTCHGGGQGHFQFKTSSFSVHNTGSLLLSSLKKVTSPLVPSFPFVPPPQKIPCTRLGTGEEGMITARSWARPRCGGKW